MRFLFQKILLFLLFIFLHSCSKITKNNIENLALENKFTKQLIYTNDFVLTSYHKITNLSAPIIFYIEGDGYAYINKYSPSNDPTPRGHSLLDVALKDNRDNIVYLARPCQYTDKSLNNLCYNNYYWTLGRFSHVTIDNISDAVNQIMKQHNISQCELYGFSGGGAVALLVTATNNNLNKKITNIVTFAGNLNHDEFTRLHNISKMTGSLNPMNYLDKLRSIPQTHIAGGKDKIVPLSVIKTYVDAINSDLVKYIIIDDASHIASDYVEK